MSNGPPDSPPRTATTQELVEKPVSEVRELLLPWEKTWNETKKRIRSFYSTRRSVVSGCPLYDWTLADISAAGLQTPLRFHVYQTVLSVIPATVILQIWSFVHPRDPYDYDVPTLQETHFAFWGRLLNPTTFPVLLLVFASTIGWASLRRRDSSRTTRARARRAVHYLAGTHYLYPAVAMSIGYVSIPIILSAAVPSTTKWALGGGVGFFCFLFILRTIWITGFLFPNELFRINGYGVDPVKTTEFTWDFVNPPPRIKFRIVWILYGWLGSATILWAYTLLVSVLAYASSALQSRVSGADSY